MYNHQVLKAKDLSDFSLGKLHCKENTNNLFGKKNLTAGAYLMSIFSATAGVLQRR